MMIKKEKQEKIIDIAWEHLYRRLEQDNLLPEKELPERTMFQSIGFRWAASFAILCICTVTAWLIIHSPPGEQIDLLVLHNEQNAPTLATTLEDGSIVFLSEQTTIRYPAYFQEDKRMITLQGDAFFEISRQPERPFFIDTDVAEIEVLGTFFHVKSSDKSTFLLSVKNGEVKVTLKKNNQTIHIKAGEAAMLESGTLQITKADMFLFDTCFEKIHFKDERVADIARIINLHSTSTRIEVSPELNDRQLTITFSGETPELMAQLICLALDLNYSQEQNIIYMTK
jgi:ferric-dicitrate binding protein FerR (iron transport regulator)